MKEFRWLIVQLAEDKPNWAYQAPNMIAYVERFIRTIKSECPGQMIFLGQDSLDRAIKEFVEHYHDERSHRGIGNRLVSGAEATCLSSVAISNRSKTSKSLK